MEMIVAGMGTPQRLCVSGMVNPYVYIHYEGDRRVELPLPEDFQEAVRQVVGYKPKSGAHPGFRGVDAVVRQPDTTRWMAPAEYLRDAFLHFLRNEALIGVRAAMYNIVANYVTRAFYELQDGNIENAKAMMRECTAELEYVFNHFRHPQYSIILEADIYAEDNAYKFEVTVYQTP